MMTTSPVTALVIGAGAFGRHYVRILSRLNRRGLAGVPMIRKLALSRTRLETALDLAEGCRANPEGAIPEITGVKIGDAADADAVLASLRPDFTGIAAKDPALGDNIHATYAALALKYGSVLCEKPFANAAGDGASLALFDALNASDGRRCFGLELPMAVVMQAMLGEKRFRDAYGNATELRFIWEKQKPETVSLLDDLALHPWSLIPEDWRILDLEAEDRGSSAVIRLLYEKPDGDRASCHIRLASGGNFRGMAVDDLTVGFRIQGPDIHAVRLEGSLEEAAGQRGDFAGETILKTENPLRRHIIAVLQGRPVVGPPRARASQLFLEMLHGYAG